MSFLLQYWLFLWRRNYRSCSRGHGFLSSAQLVEVRIEVMVISYEFLSAEDQTAEKTARWPLGGRQYTRERTGTASKEAQSNFPILLLQTDVAAGTGLQEGNTILSFICLTRLLSPITGFEANYFRVVQAGERQWNWKLSWWPGGSDMMLWEAKEVELRSRRDLEPERRSQGRRGQPDFQEEVPRN